MEIDWEHAKFDAMAFNAVDSYRELKKRDNELAEELFYKFDHEFDQLAKCLNASRDLEREYSFSNTHHIKKRRELKRRLQSVNECINFQRELVSDCIKTLQNAANSLK